MATLGIAIFGAMKNHMATASDAMNNRPTTTWSFFIFAAELE
jgi:hypothetical protein